MLNLCVSFACTSAKEQIEIVRSLFGVLIATTFDNPHTLADTRPIIVNNAHDLRVTLKLQAIVMLKESYPYYLAGEACSPNRDLEVTDKYTGEVATRVAMADAATIDQGIAATVDAAEPMRRMRPYERQQVLNHCVQRFQQRFDELAMSLCIEAGKPIKDSRGEVSRLIDTFRIAAEESVRISGEVMNLEISPRAKVIAACFNVFRSDLARSFRPSTFR